MKYAIFSSISSIDDIIYAVSLGKSLRILEIHKTARLVLVVAKDVPISYDDYNNLSIWDDIVVGEESDKHYLNILVCNLYPYVAVLYVDSHTIFFNSPIHLFSVDCPASLFNSISNAHMIHMYSDIYPANMGYLHVYGELLNNSQINPDVIDQIITGRYAGYIDNSDPPVVDDESIVTALDSRFLVLNPNTELYAYAYNNPPDDNPFLVGSKNDIAIMITYYKFNRNMIWHNLIHNYRVPRLLIHPKKNSIIYRKDTIDGLLSPDVLIYAVEADNLLSNEVGKLSNFSISQLTQLMPN